MALSTRALLPRPLPNSRPQPSKSTAGNSNVSWSASSIRPSPPEEPATRRSAHSHLPNGSTPQSLPLPRLANPLRLLRRQMALRQWSSTSRSRIPLGSEVLSATKRSSVAGTSTCVSTARPPTTGSRLARSLPRQETHLRSDSRGSNQLTPTPCQKIPLRSNPGGPPERVRYPSPPISSSRIHEQSHSRLPTLFGSLRLAAHALQGTCKDSNPSRIGGHRGNGGFWRNAWFHRHRLYRNAFSSPVSHVLSQPAFDGRRHRK